MESVIEKLLKIKRLADEGFDGEAEAAKYQLEKLMKKYEMTLDDLMGIKKTSRTFKVPKAMTQLFIQVVASVISERYKDMWSYRGASTTKYIDLTDIEYVDIEQMWSFHSKQLKKELAKQKKIVENAYYHKHELFDCNPADSDESKKETLTAEEIMEILRMTENLESVTFRKQLI